MSSAPAEEDSHPINGPVAPTFFRYLGLSILGQAAYNGISEFINEVSGASSR